MIIEIRRISYGWERKPYRVVTREGEEESDKLGRAYDLKGLYNYLVNLFMEKGYLKKEEERSGLIRKLEEDKCGIIIDKRTIEELRSFVIEKDKKSRRFRRSY